MTRLLAAIAIVVGLLASTAQAQFTGPSASGRERTVAQVRDARLGSYVTVTGNVVEHLRGEYFTFRDRTGDIRVEIESSVWQGRPVAPETKVRLVGEVDQGVAGRYLWIKSLQIVE